MTEARAQNSQIISRIKLVALIAVFAGPLLLATVWFALTDPNGNIDTRNNGELIDPATPLEAFELAGDDGQTLNLDSLRGHWTLVYFGSPECPERCQKNLYHLRQVRLSLHKEMNRLDRLYVASEMDATLRAEHPGLWVASDANNTLRGQFDAAQANMAPMPDAIYLVDPLGNLMMRFSPDLDPRKMLKDVKHLLKVSRIG